jgi:antitoxin ParD1/3/4
MSEAEKRTISLHIAEVERIERLVYSGMYASASDAAREALDALEERNASLEEWLRKEVVPVCDEVVAHPERTLSADEVFDSIRAHHEARMQKSARNDQYPHR